MNVIQAKLGVSDINFFDEFKDFNQYLSTSNFVHLQILESLFQQSSFSPINSLETFFEVYFNFLLPTAKYNYIKIR